MLAQIRMLSRPLPQRPARQREESRETVPPSRSLSQFQVRPHPESGARLTAMPMAEPRQNLPRAVQPRHSAVRSDLGMSRLECSRTASSPDSGCGRIQNRGIVRGHATRWSGHGSRGEGLHPVGKRCPPDGRNTSHAVDPSVRDEVENLWGSDHTGPGRR